MSKSVLGKKQNEWFVVATTNGARALANGVFVALEGSR